MTDAGVSYRPARLDDNHALHDVVGDPCRLFFRDDPEVALDRYLVTSPPFFV